MAYNKTSWVDDSEPAINAANLNNIENGVSDVDSRLKVLEDKPEPATATWASLPDKPTIPSIEGLATQADLDALAARVAALETPSGE